MLLVRPNSQYAINGKGRPGRAGNDEARRWKATSPVCRLPFRLFIVDRTFLVQLLTCDRYTLTSSLVYFFLIFCLPGHHRKTLLLVLP